MAPRGDLVGNEPRLLEVQSYRYVVALKRVIPGFGVRFNPLKPFITGY